MTLIDRHALADMLGLDADYVRDVLSKSRGFPDAIRLGASLRWRRDEIEQWLESRRVSAAARRNKRKVAA
jgi:predicted DNA-binding transcriptional regulator AlpA